MKYNFYKKIPTDSGFTMLIAVVVTSMLLIISFAVVNVAVKQLIVATSNKESQYAFYNADSGIECAVYWDFRGAVSAFDQPVDPISCDGDSVTPTVLSVATTTFTINLTKGCVVVQVGKHPGEITVIDSRGYNTCSGSAIRKVERAEKLVYTN